METKYEKQRRAKKHIHRYERRALKYAKSEQLIWMCNDPICSHYMPPNMLSFLIGKASRCNECDTPIVMTEDTMIHDKPMCSDCRLKLSGANVDELNEALEQFLESKETLVDKIRG